MLANSSQKSFDLPLQSQCANSARPSGSSPTQIDGINGKGKRLHHKNNGEKRAEMTMQTKECSNSSTFTPLNSAYGRQDYNWTNKNDCETSVEDSVPENNLNRPSVSSLQSGNKLAAAFEEYGSLSSHQETSGGHQKEMQSVLTIGELNVIFNLIFQ